MKKIFLGVLLGIAAALSIGVTAQMIHGNSFPFWIVRGPLTVSGNTTIGGTLAVTGATTQTSLTASLPVFTNSSKVFASNAMTGTGSVVMSASPTLTGQVLGGAGTGALPFYSFSGDPDTGIFSSAANVIGFATNGAERWVINASGALNPSTDNANDIGNGTVNPRDVNIKRNLLLLTLQTPASAAAACTTGTIAWDTGFVYVCTATNTWKRAAIVTW